VSEMKISLRDRLFIRKKLYAREFLESLGSIHRSFSLRGANNSERGFGERDADLRYSCLFVRVHDFFELLSGKNIYRSHYAVNFPVRNDSLPGCIVTNIKIELM